MPKNNRFVIPTFACPVFKRLGYILCMVFPSVLTKQDKTMIDVFQNPFSGSYFQSAQKNTGVADLPRVANSNQSSPSISSSWNTKDEYVSSVSSASQSSGAYKRSS
ncbi:MAG: hypothetical protein LBJ00_04425, partial [Planctomycetaceae bacterium]|nr:hypothetical protein [Planctomycetaceae bacterium]